MLHDEFSGFLNDVTGGRQGLRLLDIGAYQGALSARLRDAGYDVTACDKFPETFKPEDIPCDRADIEAEDLPYEAGTFDAVIAVELLEHLLRPARLFAECARVLKPGGRMLITVPNVLSLKSRISFLMTGFVYGSWPLDDAQEDGMLHLWVPTFDQIRYIAGREGLRIERLGIDRCQTRSRMWMWLYPFIRLASRRAGHNPDLHNSSTLLLGRKLFLAFVKKEDA